MADPLIVNGVSETSTTTGTGTYTLAGALTGYQSFAAVGNAKKCLYRAYDVDGNGNPTANGWEIGVGTYTSAGTTLSRDTILESTNGGAAVSWSAGTRRIIATTPKEALDKIYHPTDTFANLTGQLAGRLCFPSNGIAVLRDTGSAMSAWGPLFKFTDPTLQTFSWVNQGSSTVDTTNGGILLSSPSAAGMAIRKKSAPSTPYTITGAITGCSAGNSGYPFWGLCFRESGTGKIVGLQVNCNMGTPGALAYQVQYWSSPTTFSSTPWNGGLNNIAHCPVLWLRIKADGTNLIYYISVDGQHWNQVYTHAKNAIFTTSPDEVGFFAGSNGAGQVDTLLHSWQEG